jgi:hypothetical protein
MKSATTSPPVAERGVLLVALGHPNYGRLAANLALSIRANDPPDARIPIALAWADQALQGLSAQQVDLFDSLIECPQAHFHTPQGRHYPRAKTCLNALSPFAHTLYLDVDTLVFPPVAHQPQGRVWAVLDELVADGAALSFHNSGTAGVLRSGHVWGAPLADIWAAYGLAPGTPLWEMNSSLLYWRRCTETEAWFDRAQTVMDHPRIHFTEWAGGMPDELALEISLAQAALSPHQPDWHPLFFWDYGKAYGYDRQQIRAQHIGLTLAGNRLPPIARRLYNELIVPLAYAAHDPHPWKYQEKHRWLKERKRL